MKIKRSYKRISSVWNSFSENGRAASHGALAFVAYLIWHCLFRMQGATMLIPLLYALHVLWSKAVSKASNFSSRQCTIFANRQISNTFYRAYSCNSREIIRLIYDRFVVNVYKKKKHYVDDLLQELIQNGYVSSCLFRLIH